MISVHTELKSLYENLIKIDLSQDDKISTVADRLRDHTLTCAPAIEGSKFNSCKDKVNNSFRLMYVGRAMNGWELPCDKNTSDDQLIPYIFKETEKQQCHNSTFTTIMQEIGQGLTFEGKYNYNTSPFWQLAHEILAQRVHIYSEEATVNITKVYKRNGVQRSVLIEKLPRFDWPQNLLWSNLFKVSPYLSGNPSEELKGKILSTCLDIISKEIELYEPTHIVFVTGNNGWFRLFSNEFNNCSISVDKDDLPQKGPHSVHQFILAKGCFDFKNISPKFVVTARPESFRIKRDCAEVCARAAEAKAILDAFDSIQK